MQQLYPLGRPWACATREGMALPATGASAIRKGDTAGFNYTERRRWFEPRERIVAALNVIGCRLLACSREGDAR